VAIIVAHHVMLKYLGSYGNEASFQKIGAAMVILKGAVNECVVWACSAILKLQTKVAHGFVNCVGLIDGMLFPLAFAPTLNAEDYFTRKGNYVIKGLLTCDDDAKITWIEMGWPGSVHNNQVWSNSDAY